MSEQKDPIAEQIERDARKFASGILGIDVNDILPDDTIISGFTHGATAQDRIATNRTVTAMRNLLVKYIAQIIQAEGIDYIPSPGVRFNESEVVILELLSKEAHKLL